VIQRACFCKHVSIFLPTRVARLQQVDPEDKHDERMNRVRGADEALAAIQLTQEETR
jgi:hypothetical protein